MKHAHVNWLYDAPLYSVLFLLILFGFTFAEPGTPFAAFTVAVFLFWIVGIYRFAKKRQSKLKSIQHLLKDAGNGVDAKRLVELEKDMVKPFWAIF